MKLLLFAAAGFGPSAWVLAQVSSSPDSIAGWLTGSAVTVLAAAVLAYTKGWVVSGKLYDRAIAENDLLRDELRTRNKEDRETLIPMIVESMTQALNREREGGKA